MSGNKSAASKAMPPPPSRRPFNRAQSTTPAPSAGRASPAESVFSSRARSPASQAGTAAGIKRKERDFDRELEETNINVVVRCRGRNDREVRENSGVVVRTDGLKGKTVELSMGPSALSNKTYQFDKVFSPAADQTMVFDEVVKPILDEVLSGFNCTIFAYGQTGTGKTFTMSGDITDMRPLSDNAGVIPRVLHELFDRLDGTESESSVKVSFIELYNEELRDLLSTDDNVRLKIYEENKKGHSATLVQGMEESHIISASKGIQLLRRGSQKRQVAATKCNDLSSRSHTIFTVTVYTKRTSDTGEDFISAGKLNLVDLAGSENIQRSGAENKRAAEAGLINKSLLTLGRVINALVDKTGHVPYRESKLTRLLQDSLGGRTKTCIIATLSPAKSNLEETISTLDYAFRAKNIRNVPQINGMISKKTLLKEYALEIEKLKSELIATRQRNGVYLTQEAYEDMVTTGESLKILSDEQKEKIESMEIHLRNKVQELFSLNTNFNSLKKDNETTRLLLDGTKSVLEKTEAVLADTRQSLAEETTIRKAHQKTEEQLVNVGQELISTLDRTTSDIGGLYSKLRRRSNLHSVNREQWNSAQERVSESTNIVEERLGKFQAQQAALINSLAVRMESFVQSELQKLEASQAFLKEKAQAFEESRMEVDEQTSKSRDDLNQVLEEIKALREDVKQKVGAGLNDLSEAAQRISAGIMSEIDAFQTQFHSSYASLGKEFKGTFDDLLKELNEQQSEAETLRAQITEANNELLTKHAASAIGMIALLEEERRTAAEERQTLLAQVGALINSASQRQEQRLENGFRTIQSAFEDQRTTHGVAQQSFLSGSEQWSVKSRCLAEKVAASRDTLKTKIRSDFATANERTAALRNVTTSVHESTTRIVDEQIIHLDTELHALDDIVHQIKEQNNLHHTMHVESLQKLGSTVDASYNNIGTTFAQSFARVQDLSTDMTDRTGALKETLSLLNSDADIRTELSALREDIEAQALQEYTATGQTPAKQQYDYPSALPRTEPREKLLARLRSRGADASDTQYPALLTLDEQSCTQPDPPRSPSKGLVFTDAQADNALSAESDANSTTRSSSLTSSTAAPASLRELDPNTAHAHTITLPLSLSAIDPEAKAAILLPPLKRLHTTGTSVSIAASAADPKLPTAAAAPGPAKRRAARMTTAAVAGLREERENALPNLSASVGAATGHPMGRRAGLRSQGGL